MTLQTIKDDFYKQFHFSQELGFSGQILSGGKGYRASFLELLSKIVPLTDEDLGVLKDVTESLHTATLIHDDVLDQASKRRGAPSFNTTLDNKKSILLGDYYLSVTIQKLCEVNNILLVRELSEALKSLVEGEWLQARLTHQNYSLDDYEELATQKTGSLFTWCLRAPFLYHRLSPHRSLSFKVGQKLGILFQLVDDLMDFANTGKSSLIDLENGNPNYVLIRIREKFSPLELDRPQLLKMAKVEIKLAQEKIDSLRAEVNTDFKKLLENSPFDDEKLLFEEFTEALATRHLTYF